MNEGGESIVLGSDWNFQRGERVVRVGGESDNHQPMQSWHL